MPVTLSIKNAPDDVVTRLRERAKRNHRSLQGELLAIIEAAAEPAPIAADRIDALRARIKALNLPAGGERSVNIIRGARDTGYSFATNPNHHADSDADC